MNAGDRTLGRKATGKVWSQFIAPKNWKPLSNWHFLNPQVSGFLFALLFVVCVSFLYFVVRVHQSIGTTDLGQKHGPTHPQMGVLPFRVRGCGYDREAIISILALKASYCDANSLATSNR